MKLPIILYISVDASFFSGDPPGQDCVLFNFVFSGPLDQSKNVEEFVELNHFVLF